MIHTYNFSFRLDHDQRCPYMTAVLYRCTNMKEHIGKLNSTRQKQKDQRSQNKLLLKIPEYLTEIPNSKSKVFVQ